MIATLGAFFVLIFGQLVIFKLAVIDGATIELVKYNENIFKGSK